MKAAPAIDFLLFCLSAGFVGMGVGFTFRLTPDKNRREAVRWLASWLGKGMLLPLIIWGLMNVGLAWNLQAFMPQIQAAQNSGLTWFGIWFHVLMIGALVITSYWAAVTLTWVLATTNKAVDPEAQSQFKALCWTCGVGLGIPALLVALIGGWPLLGVAASVVVCPIAGYAPGVLQPQKTPPLYARAIARIKFGKYSEAEWEIIQELEKSEDDFEGWMMLAELYATRFSDIEEAEKTIREICDQPKLTPSQLSIALHRLADWQLNVAGNPDAARRALQMIVDRLKGTHLAHMARLRLNQLPRTVEELQERKSGTRIPLPALGNSLDPKAAPEIPPLERKQAALMANACVAQLNSDPNNAPAREKLARLFSEHLERADLGIEQVQLLLNMPDQPDDKRAEWLALIASWYLRYRDDPATACRFLERLLQDFPASPHTIGARRRLEQARARLT